MHHLLQQSVSLPNRPYCWFDIGLCIWEPAGAGEDGGALLGEHSGPVNEPQTPSLLSWLSPLSYFVQSPEVPAHMKSVSFTCIQRILFFFKERYPHLLDHLLPDPSWSAIS